MCVVSYFTTAGRRRFLPLVDPSLVRLLMEGLRWHTSRIEERDGVSN
jgi:hypothetical protein